MKLAKQALLIVGAACHTSPASVRGKWSDEGPRSPRAIWFYALRSLGLSWGAIARETSYNEAFIRQEEERVERQCAESTAFDDFVESIVAELASFRDDPAELLKGLAIQPARAPLERKERAKPPGRARRPNLSRALEIAQGAGAENAAARIKALQASS